MLRKSCDNKTIRITSSTLMNKHLLILWMLATGLLEKHSLQASEITEEADKATSVHKDSSSFMTHQDLENRLLSFALDSNPWPLGRGASALLL